MTYTLSYDDQPLAEVEICESHKSSQAILEMVEFWSGWEDRLKRAKGDYTLCWLRMLANQLLLEGRSVALRDIEGWAPLDGSYGIKLTHFWPWEPDEDLITIERANT